MNYENLNTSYGIYRTKTAVRVSFIPIRKKKDTGYPAIGGYMFHFANAIDDTSYDWQNGPKFFLSANEAGDLIHAFNVGGDIKLYHDPYKGSENEGTRGKNFSIVTSGDKRYLNYSDGETKIGVSLSINDEVILSLLISSTLSMCYGWSA